MTKQIEFLERCKAVNLHSGSLFDWLARVETLQAENAALKEQVAQLERIPEADGAEYKTWWELALHVGAWKDHDLDYVHFGSEMAVRAFAIHLLHQRDKFEAEQQQTITAMQSKSAALVDALQYIIEFGFCAPEDLQAHCEAALGAFKEQS